MWGIFDTEDKIWIGNDDGPCHYEDKMTARLSAEVADVVLGQKIGRCRARRLPKGSWKLRDEKPTIMKPEKALRLLEEGYLP